MPFLPYLLNLPPGSPGTPPPPLSDAKISGLTAKATPAAADLLVIVDVTDTSMAPTGTDKKTTVGGLALAQSQVTGLVAALAPLGPGGTPGRVPYWGTGPVLADSADLAWDTGLTIHATSGFFPLTVLDIGGAVGVRADPLGNLLVNGAIQSATGFQVTVFGAYVGVDGANRITFPNASPSVLANPISASQSVFGVIAAAAQTAPLVALQGPSSTSTARDLGYLDAGFTVSTDATFTGYVDLDANDHAGRRKGLRVAADGTRALLGFFGASPVAKPAAPATLADVIALLQALGLCS